MDNESGKLSEITSATGITNPSYITVSDDIKDIYASSEGKIENGGTVSSFQFNNENKVIT